MQEKSNTVGLSFKKLDLHVHTPASDCFEGTCTPEELIQTALDQKLAGIAVTDHNTPNWIDKVIAAAKGKPLAVFPAVEVTCQSGEKSIHIVGIFDVTERAELVKTLLTKLDIYEADYGKQETLAQKTPQEVIRAIHDLGGLPVLAHANSSNGVLSDMTGQGRIAVVQCPPLAAIEATDFKDESKKQKRKRVVDLLNGTDPSYQRKLAVYQASDNPCPDGSGRHCLAGIGTRCAYFKMERVNLDSLRQCFADPNVRIKQDFELQTFVYPHIRSIKITGGFLDKQEACFHSGLNSILGAKGAGKSLLVEFLRFGLNQEPRHEDIRRDHDSKLRSRLGEYGIIEVLFIDEVGEEFRIRRTYRELDESLYNSDDVPYDPAQVFPVLFLSQNEIIRIAEDEDEQLAFIDRFFDFRTFKSQIDVYERDLARLDARMAEGLRAYTDYEELTKQVETSKAEIARLDAALSHPIFEQYRQLELKERALSEQDSYFVNLTDNLEMAHVQIVQRGIPDIPEQLRSDPALRRNRDVIESAKKALEEQFALLGDNIIKAKAKTSKEHEVWRPSYQAGKKEYDTYIQSMGGDYRLLAANRAKAVKKLEELERSRASAERKKNDVPQISERRNRLLDALQQEYDKYGSERRAKCVKFQEDSAGKLKLRILGSSNVDEFKTSLLSLKRGSYLREYEIEAISTNVTPRDFIMALLRYEATRESRHLEKTAKDAGIEISRMKTLADFLLATIPYEQLLALQYQAIPQDRPEILYNIGGGSYQPLNAVSVGQKATAMLIMALSDGVMPIVIDQPEDSLDIRSIWEDICVKLRNGKERRQFLFTTHNSSLAVASDTDCFTIVEGDASNGRIMYSGAMDHQPMSEEVLKYLEGGVTTYQWKFTKYNGDRRLQSKR